MTLNLGRTETAVLTNKSGGSVAQGDVVIVDIANAEAFTTTTISGYGSGRIGVILEPNGIANNGRGLVAFSGFVPIINLSGTGNIGDLVKTHTVAKQGVRHAAPVAGGDFAQVLGTSATPSALLFGTALQSAFDSSALNVTGTFALSGDVSPSQITANQNDYNPAGLSTSTVLRLSSDASRNITGLQGGADGRLIVIENVGSNNIVLKDSDIGSSAANRFALSADITLAADDAVILKYDSTSSCWRCIGKSPGGVGGGGGTTFYDRRFVRGSSPHAQDDEFNDGSIAVAWTRVDQSGHEGYVTWAEGGDALSVMVGNSSDGGPDLHCQMKSYSIAIGEAIATCIKGSGKDATYPLAGLIISNGVTYGAGVQAVEYFIDVSALPNRIADNQWTNFNTRSSNNDTIGNSFNGYTHMKLEYSAANQFKFYASPDGIQWILLATRSITMTPTHIGLCATGWTSTTPFIFSFDYFRVF